MPEQFEIVELKDRQIIDVPPLLNSLQSSIIRHFGVALDNDEAQRYIKLGLRVFGDEQGPYLVVRVGRNQSMPAPIYRQNVTIRIQPISWQAGDFSGVICWLVDPVRPTI